VPTVTAQTLCSPALNGLSTVLLQYEVDSVQYFDVSRRVALEGQRNVIREKINQLEAQILGSEKQVAAFRQQIGCQLR
jgi:hypothetical protein